MANLIIRLFSDAASAESAIKELKAHGFGDKDIFVVGPKAGANEAAIATVIASHKILKADAAVVAKSVAKGAVMVGVRAIFGAGAKTLTLLERHGAMPSGLEPPEEDGNVYWDDEAPLSSAIHVPPLLNDASPFSRFWNIPTLVNRQANRGSLWTRIRAPFVPAKQVRHP